MLSRENQLLGYEISTNNLATGLMLNLSQGKPESIVFVCLISLATFICLLASAITFRYPHKPQIHTSAIVDRSKPRKNNNNKFAKKDKLTASHATWRRLIHYFSVQRSLEELISRYDHGNHSDLANLDTLKVVSTLQVILIHSYGFAMMWLNFRKTQSLENIYSSLYAQIVANGSFAVDNFFLISGLLAWHKHHRLSVVGHTLVGCCTRSQKARLLQAPSFNWPMLSKSFLKRFLRLAPSLMLSILLSVYTLSSLEPPRELAPGWLNASQMFDSWCRHRKWLLNLLMLHNLIGTNTMCFSHSWYVAVDFQLFILVPLVLIAMSCLLFRLAKCFSLNRAPIAIDHLIWVAILINQCLVAGLVYSNNLPPMPNAPSTSEAMIRFYSTIYIRPHQWLSSYLIGCWLAERLLSKGSRPRSRPGMSLVSVLACMLILFVLLMSLWPYLGLSYTMTAGQAFGFAFLARPLWSACLGQLLYTWTLSLKVSRGQKKGNSIRVALCRPLARLSYLVYLLHPVVMAVSYGYGTGQSVEFSHWLLVKWALQNTLITYLLAFLVHLLFEAPLSGLLKQLWLAHISKGGASSR